MTRLYVYVNGKHTCTETNLAYALPYWQARKQLRAKDGVRITWKIQ
jgi:hypothetical protein